MGVSGGSRDQNSGEEIVIAPVREACRAAARAFPFCSFSVFFLLFVFFCSLSSRAKWIPLHNASSYRRRTLMSSCYPGCKKSQIQSGRNIFSGIETFCN